MAIDAGLIRCRAPWVRCDREKDYEVAWKHFAERFGKEGPDRAS